MTSYAKAPRPLKEASIIVVEDHTFVRDRLTRMLKPVVGALHGAVSAEDAFYNLEQTPGLVHVAIVDFHLPGMDGIRFIEKLRAAKSSILRKLPVVILTGENSLELYRRAQRLGIAAFLMKPVALATLVEALEGALAGRRAGAPKPDMDTQPAPEAAPVKAKAGKTKAAEAPPEPIDFKT